MAVAPNLISRLGLSEATRSNIKSRDIDGPITESHLLRASFDTHTLWKLIVASPGNTQLTQDFVRMEAYKSLLYAQDRGRHFGDHNTGDTPNGLLTLINTKFDEQKEEFGRMFDEQKEEFGRRFDEQKEEFGRRFDEQSMEIQGLSTEVQGLKKEVQGLKKEVQGLKKEAQGSKKELQEVKSLAKDQVGKAEAMSGILRLPKSWNMGCHEDATMPLQIMEVPGGIPLHLPRLTSRKAIQDLSVKDLQEYLQLYKIPPSKTAQNPRTRQVPSEDILADRKALTIHLWSRADLF